jgi:hypothetical protein
MFPEAIKDREEFIARCVQEQDYGPIEWGTIVSTQRGHEARFTVFCDALKIAGVRVNASDRLQRRIAEMLGCSLLTPKLADLIWCQRAVTLKPHPMKISSSTAAMIQHSERIDHALAAHKGGLVCTVGKHWVIDHPRWTIPGRAINYGWHFEGSSFEGIKGELAATGVCRVIQGRGRRHDPSHVDYSQTVVLVRNEVVVDGSTTTVQDLAKSELNYLLF